MRACWITAILIAMTVSGYAQEDKGGSSLDRGIAAWLVNNQEDALPLIRMHMHG
jgi:hypothetical protein